VDEAIALGVEEVLLTGGEPLLSPDLWPIAERLKKRASVRCSRPTAC
jgi:molybdenum cofactor biosynthesis enzyme MoaA